MKIIRTRQDAYAVATELIDGMQIEQAVTWQATTFTKVNADCVIVAGDRAYGKSGMFYPCELADLVLYPGRKTFNDYIRSRLLAAAPVEDIEDMIV